MFKKIGPEFKYWIGFQMFERIEPEFQCLKEKGRNPMFKAIGREFQCSTG